VKTVHYFLTPSSPWTYLGHERFVSMCRRHGATIQLKPADLGRVFPQSGGLPLAKRAPQRQAYRLHELARWRDHLGVPLNIHPKHFPVPADDAARLIIAADLAAGTDAALALAFALMRAVWAEERDIADAATRAAITTECGLDPALLARFPDRLVRFPMLEGERSLNLATAVCAAVYEGLRQAIARGDVRTQAGLLRL
jgi:2-hydroxychromene-2-carboxylate isomerase